MNSIPHIQIKIYKVVILVIVVVVLVLSFVFYHKDNVRYVPFWPFDVSYAMIQLVSLFLVALFIERALEVLIVVWRERGKTEILNRLEKAVKKSEFVAKGGARVVTHEEEKAYAEYKNYKADTACLAIPTAFVLGVIIGVAGIRVLQPFVDPAVFKSLTTSQKALFTCLDILITGALLGGGSKGIHEIIEAFLNTVEKYREYLKTK
jgi:hypothetical protein